LLKKILSKTEDGKIKGKVNLRL